jgi:O-antigen/teichoic acid export membrane protein
MNRAERFQKLTCTAEVRSELRTRSVRAATFTWAASVADFVLRFGSTAILARLVLPDHFGLVMMVMAVTAIADQFRDLGLSTVTVQRKEITHQEVSNLFWINVAAGLIIALIVCAAAPLVSAYYKEPRLTVLTYVLASSFVWGGLMVQHQALLTRVLKLGHNAAVRVLASVLSTILAVVLAWKGFGYWALVWREISRCALLTIGMWLCFPWMPGWPSRKTNVWGMVRFGADLSAAFIVASIGGSADRFLLGRFAGAGPVAMYRQAYQLLVTATEQLLSPIYQVTQPGLSMLQTEAARFRNYYRKVLTLACLATMPLSLFVAVFSAEITRIVLGRKWLAAAPLLFWLGLATFIKQPVGSAAFVLITRGRSRTFLWLTLLHIITGIVLMCIGVRWGTVGVAIAEVATTYLLIGPRLHYCFKDSPMTVGCFFSTIARPATASLAMATGLFFLRGSLPAIGAPAVLVIGGLVGGVVFCATWFLLPGGKSESLELIADLRTAWERKRKRVESVQVDPVAVAN